MPLTQQVLVERRWERKEASLSDFGVPGLTVLPPLGIMDHPFFQVQAGRGRGVTPRVTQSALLRSLATLTLTDPSLPSGKRIPAERER